jgi:hypothetical protein
MFIKTSVTAIIHHGGLCLFGWNEKHTKVSCVMFEVMFTHTNQIINQANTLGYIGVSDSHNRYVFVYNEATLMNGTTFSSSMTRTRATSTYHHVIELITSMILGYNLINEK